MEGRLIGVCCGLIETVSPRNDPGKDEIPIVTFIHKSVADFLRQPDIWNYITNLTNDKQSNMYHILATSSLTYMKNDRPPETSPTPETTFPLFYTRYCLGYLRAAETSEQATMLETLHDLQAYLVDTGRYRDYDATILGDAFKDLLDTLDLDGLPDFRADFYIAAYGLLPLHFQQVHSAYRTQDSYQCSKDESWLLRSLLTARRLEHIKNRDFLPEHMQIIEYLFQQGVDVNAKEFEKRSAWHQLLLMLKESRDTSDSGTTFYIDLIPLFVQNGASWQEKHSFPSGYRLPYGRSAKEIVEALEFGRYPDPETRAILEKRRRLLLAEMSELDGRKNEQVRPNKQKKSSLSKLLSRLSKKT